MSVILTIIENKFHISLFIVGQCPGIGEYEISLLKIIHLILFNLG